MGMDQYLLIPFSWDEHPFTSYFDVQQGYKVLTHCHIFPGQTSQFRCDKKGLGLSPPAAAKPSVPGKLHPAVARRPSVKRCLELFGSKEDCHLHIP